MTSFNFEGRIRRTDYWISLIMVTIFITLINLLKLKNDSFSLLEILVIPALWHLIAQGTKRCHDLGKPGYYQIIPFYIFPLLFSEGDKTENTYGFDPKEKIKNLL